MALKQIKKPEFRETEKFNRWVRCFYDIKDKECFGNATRSALKSYNTKNYNTASVIGHKNIRKAKIMAVSIVDQLGYGFADLIKIGLAKMMKGGYSDWDRFMVRLGYFEPENKIGVAIQNNFDFSGQEEAIRKSRQERGLLT